MRHEKDQLFTCEKSAPGCEHTVWARTWALIVSPPWILPVTSWEWRHTWVIWGTRKWPASSDHTRSQAQNNGILSYQLQIVPQVNQAQETGVGEWQCGKFQTYFHLEYEKWRQQLSCTHTESKPLCTHLSQILCKGIRMPSSGIP